MKNFIKPSDVVTFTAAADLSGGDLVLLGTAKLPGVVSYSVLTGESGEACTIGIYELPKVAADTPTEFAKAYWNATDGAVTTTASGNTLIGTFAKAAGNGETTCQVRLSGVSA